MKALICGVSGQDGSYLAKYLLDKGYEVLGTSRDSSTNNFLNLKILGIYENFKIVSMTLNDFGSVFEIVKEFNPDEIYNLAGQSSVGLSFKQPVNTMNSIANGCLNLLEVIRVLNPEIKFYNAGSGECFGNTVGIPASEKTVLNPCSPYGVAKASSYWIVRNYREAYGLYGCTGILFNHESPLRADRFVTQKIVKTALKIKNKELNTLKVGNINIMRDWGWAPDYIEAIWLMMQQTSPKDYVIATGVSNKLSSFIEKTFSYFDMDWQKYVKVDESLLRPSEIEISIGNPKLAFLDLNWKANINFDELINKMCHSASSRKNF